MNEKLTYKEILLIRKVFTSKKFSETISKVADNLLLKKEKVLVVYNNLLLSLIPEISEQNSVSKKLFICKMTESLLLLELRFGERDVEPEVKYSIDPNSFMPSKIFS